MLASSESGHHRRPWHLRAGGGAVHSIKSRRGHATSDADIALEVSAVLRLRGTSPIYAEALRALYGSHPRCLLHVTYRLASHPHTAPRRDGPRSGRGPTRPRGK